MAGSWIYAERLTNAAQTIDTDHAYIHEGYAFQVGEVASINGTRKYRFKTPSSTESNFRYIHMRPNSIDIEKGTLLIRFQEGSTSVSTGTAVTPVNRNRNSATTSSVTFVPGVTATTAGTDIYSQKLHAGGGDGNGGQSVEPLEWVLKPNTEYIINLTTTAATSVSANFFWYEEEMGV